MLIIQIKWVQLSNLQTLLTKPSSQNSAHFKTQLLSQTWSVNFMKINQV